MRKTIKRSATDTFTSHYILLQTAQRLVQNPNQYDEQMVKQPKWASGHKTQTKGNTEN